MLELIKLLLFLIAFLSIMCIGAGVAGWIEGRMYRRERRGTPNNRRITYP